MQTVATMAKRLGMSVDSAVTALSELGHTVPGGEAELSDEQCDLLIEFDEDPTVIQRKRAKMEEEARKRAEKTERLLKANAKRKEATTKKKSPATTKSGKTKSDFDETDEEGAESAEAKAKPVAEILPPEVIEPKPVPAPEESAPVEPVKEKEPVAPAIVIGTAIEHAAKPIEIVRADGSVVDVPEIVDIIEPIATEAVVEVEEEEVLAGPLAEAERRQEEDERRKAKIPAPRLGPPRPDAAVVAEVKRKAAERNLRLLQQRGMQGSPQGAPGGGGHAPSAGPSRPQQTNTASGPPIAQGGGSRGGQYSQAPGAGGRSGGPSQGGAPRGSSGGGRMTPGGAQLAVGKTARKKQKKAEKMRFEEGMRRDAAMAVREYESGGMFAGGPKKRKHRRLREDGEIDPTGRDGGETEILEVQEGMTVEELSNAMEIGVNDVILELMEHNVLATKNQQLSIDLIRQIAEVHGFEVRAIIPEEDEALAEEPPQDGVVQEGVAPPHLLGG